MVSFPSNVQLDPGSGYGWDELNETRFLSRLFRCLEQEMGPAFGGHHFFVFSSHNPHAVPPSAALDLPNKVLFFISDESPSIHSTLALQSSYRSIFKCYLPCELPGTRVHPLQPGYVGDLPEWPLKPLRERTVDAFFSGNLNPNRYPLYRACHPLLRRFPAGLVNPLLRRLPPRWRRRSLDRWLQSPSPTSWIGFTDGFRQGLSPAEYVRLLHDSRIVICPRGFASTETFRHLEALRAGAVVVSERLPDTAFYRGSPMIEVPDWYTGLRRIRDLLLQPARLEELHRASLNWWHEVCSERATARYVWQRIQAGYGPA